MDFKGQIITDLATLHQVLATAPEVVTCDTETYKTRPTEKDARLLGLSLSWEGSEGPVSCYIPLWNFKNGKWAFASDKDLPDYLYGFFRAHKLIGWNSPYDKSWLDDFFGTKTKWHADAQIMWHLSNQDESIRRFGLKAAQKILLGWTETNEEALERNVQAKGGALRNGDHYMADLPVLAHYAQLDTLSTLLCYQKLAPFFDKHDYWAQARRSMEYAFLLKEATDLGIACNLEKLKLAREFYVSARLKSEESLRAECKDELAQLEVGWKTEKAQDYKTARAANAFLSSPARWSRFNPASGQQRALLLHQVLGLPINERTPTGLAKTSRDVIQNLPHPAARHLAEYSEHKKLQEMTETFIENWTEGRLHPGYNINGTVSGRLGGFSPYLLNAPFSEHRIMSAFTVEPGYVGVHADLTAIEPCVTACYSEDPNLLKVYRDGKGDIYLDLALELFPDRADLRADYDPNGPAPSAAVKERYKDLRGVCKIVHLAVGYTGSYFTVAKSLNKAGFPTTEMEARILVARYWKKFAKVKEFTKKLKAVYQEQGHIRNLTGRIIHVDPHYIKDLLNRLVQSSGHDILMHWVGMIGPALTAAGVPWLPMLVDVHDATNVMVPEAFKEQTRAIFLSTLEELNQQLSLGVKIKAEAKFFTTLAGLKEDEA